MEVPPTRNSHRSPPKCPSVEPPNTSPLPSAILKLEISHLDVLVVRFLEPLRQEGADLLPPRSVHPRPLPPLAHASCTLYPDVCVVGAGDLRESTTARWYDTKARRLKQIVVKVLESIIYRLSCLIRRSP